MDVKHAVEFCMKLLISPEATLVIVLTGMVLIFVPETISIKLGEFKFLFIFALATCSLIVMCFKYCIKTASWFYRKWIEEKRTEEEKADEVRHLIDHIKTIFPFLSRAQKNILLTLTNSKSNSLFNNTQKDVVFLMEKNAIVLTDKINVTDGLYKLNKEIEPLMKKILLMVIDECIENIDCYQKEFLMLFLEDEPLGILGRELCSAKGNLIDSFVLNQEQFQTHEEVTLSDNALSIVQQKIFLGKAIKREAIIISAHNLPGIQGGGGTPPSGGFSYP